jgi:hypothetical protein
MNVYAVFIKSQTTCTDEHAANLPSSAQEANPTEPVLDVEATIKAASVEDMPAEATAAATGALPLSPSPQDCKPIMRRDNDTTLTSSKDASAHDAAVVVF